MKQMKFRRRQVYIEQVFEIFSQSANSGKFPPEEYNDDYAVDIPVCQINWLGRNGINFVNI